MISLGRNFSSHRLINCKKNYEKLCVSFNVIANYYR